MKIKLEFLTALLLLSFSNSAFSQNKIDISCSYIVDGAEIRFTQKENKIQVSLDQSTQYFSGLLTSDPSDSMSEFGNHMLKKNYAEMLSITGTYSFKHTPKETVFVPKTDSEGKPLTLKNHFALPLKSSSDGLEVVIYEDGTGFAGIYSEINASNGKMRVANKTALLNCK